MHRPSRRNRDCSRQFRRENLLSYFFSTVDRSSLPILFGSCLFVGQTFFLLQQTDPFRFLPLFFSLLSSLVFCGAALFVERWLDRLVGLFWLRFSRIIVIFLLFFILVVGYLLLASLLISTPMAFVLAKCSFSPEFVNRFALQNCNCALALALVSWLRRLLPLIRKTEGHPVLHLRFNDH